MGLAHARSGGLGKNELYGCDIDTMMGCPTNKWGMDMNDATVRRECYDPPSNNTGKIMWWTGGTKPSSNWTLRTNDDPSVSDPTTYNPGQAMSIYIRAKVAFPKFCGLLLYAKNADGKKVGEWSAPQASDFTPDTSCVNSLMHFSARDKPYLSKFTFTAPPSGNGTLTFHLLLKSGMPNPATYGDFFEIQPKLRLTENTNPPFQGWSMLKTGQSCDSYCGAKNLTCGENAMAAVTSENIIPTLSTLYACSEVSFSDCIVGGPQSVDGRCTARQVGCTATDRLCARTSEVNSTHLFCRCLGGGETNTAATKRAFSLAALLFAFFAFDLQGGALSGRGRSLGLLVMGLLVVFGPAQVLSHNWLEGSRGRAFGASTINPSFPALAPNAIHVQVGIGQPFIVAWAPAHTGPVYLVVFHADDEANNKKHSRQNLDKYLAGGDNATRTLVKTDKLHMKLRRTDKNFNMATSTQEVETTKAPIQSIFKMGAVSDTATLALHGERPLTFPNGFGRAGTSLYEYIPDCLKDDAYASYVNPEFPWIEAVHKYHTCGQGAYEDTIMMRIPARKGPGRYQVHYMWQGFFDTLDADVQAQPVTNPYGTPVADATFSPVYHCVFEEPRRVSSCLEVVEDATQCAKICSAASSCIGYQLIPLKGRGLFPEYDMIPWNLDKQCNKTLFDLTNPSTFVCYAITQARPELNFAQAPFTIFDDPDSAGFYGTCFVKLGSVTWDKPLAKTYADVPPDTIEFHSKCVTCGALLKIDWDKPDWMVSKDCAPCGPEVIQQLQQVSMQKSSQLAPPGYYGAAKRADGFFNCTDPDTYYAPVYGKICSMGQEITTNSFTDPKTNTTLTCNEWNAKCYSTDCAATPAGVIAMFKPSTCCKGATPTPAPTLPTVPCFKWIATQGSPTVTPPECFSLTTEDPECSSTVAFSPTRFDSALTQIDGNGQWRGTSATDPKYKSCACLRTGHKLNIQYTTPSQACNFMTSNCVEGFSIYETPPRPGNGAAALMPGFTLMASLLSLLCV